MSQIEGQITKRNVNLLPSSFKKNKSNNRYILGHRTSGNRIVHFDSFYSFFSFFYFDSFFFQCNFVLKCSIAIYRAVTRDIPDTRIYRAVTRDIPGYRYITAGDIAIALYWTVWYWDELFLITPVLWMLCEHFDTHQFNGTFAIEIISFVNRLTFLHCQLGSLLNEQNWSKIACKRWMSLNWACS